MSGADELLVERVRQLEDALKEAIEFARHTEQNYDCDHPHAHCRCCDAARLGARLKFILNPFHTTS